MGPWQLIELIDRLRTSEQVAVADLWHDGPAQHLSAATFALEMIARSGPPASRARIHEILQWLDSVASTMRVVTEGRRTGAGEAMLGDALRQQSALLLTESLEVWSDSGLTALAAAEEAAIVTVVEFLLDVIARRQVKAQVEVLSDERFISLDLAVYPGSTAAASGDSGPMPELAALDAAARALGGWAETTPGAVGWLAHVVLRRRPAIKPD